MDTQSSAIEQFNIDLSIRKSRQSCDVEEGETMLCLLDGGLSKSWQEVALETTQSTDPETAQALRSRFYARPDPETDGPRAGGG
jgi:hypothetical protein